MTALEEIEKEELRLSEEDDENELPPADIVAYSELRSCADIERMFREGRLEINPDFQRGVVWQKPEISRFIDSLIKRLPIPSMCFSLDYKNDRRIVIDGLQRINSIIQFLTNDTMQISGLPDIDESIRGKSILQIKSENPELIARIRDTTIPVTVIRCDTDKASHMEFLFTIFHRLNTGGKKLNNQEIRNCIYSGAFNDSLKKLVISATTRLFNLPQDKESSKRFELEEFNLRFFAFYDNYANYHGKLAKFLSEYMYSKRKEAIENLFEKERLFSSVVNFVLNRILKPGDPIINSKTRIESLLVGVAKNLDQLEQASDRQISDAYEKFLQIEALRPENLRGQLSDRIKVKERITKSIEAFSV